MVRKTLSLLAFFTMIAFARVASAGPIIYDNGAPNLAGGNPSDFNIANQAGDDFTLSAGADVIAGIHWWGGYEEFMVGDNLPDGDDGFTIRIYEIDQFNVPEVNPTVLDLNVGHVGRVDTGDSAASSFSPFEYSIYEYSVDITPIQLISDTSYMLSIVNNTPNDEDSWFWTTSDGNGTSWLRTIDGNLWGELTGADYAFNLTGPAAVPEPATLLLMGLGLAGLGFARWRRLNAYRY